MRRECLSTTTPLAPFSSSSSSSYVRVCRDKVLLLLMLLAPECLLKDDRARLDYTRLGGAEERREPRIVASYQFNTAKCLFTYFLFNGEEDSIESARLLPSSPAPSSIEFLGM